MQITLNKEWRAHNGYASADEALAEHGEFDDVDPALCSEGCQVEPDGYCPHGAHLVGVGPRADLNAGESP